MIKAIEPSQASALCHQYAEKWDTGHHEPDPTATWYGKYEGERLVGAIGWIDDGALRRRMVLSWHVDATRMGKLAARELINYAIATTPAGWMLLGTVTPKNEAARAFLTKIGCEEAAVIFTLRRS
jgi:hypothetical protein